MIQIGGVYTTFCQEGGILLQKYRDRNGRCIAILFKSIGVRGRFDVADCVNSSSPLILRKFPGFSGIWANSGKFGKFRENSGELSGIQWGYVWRLV